LTNRHAEVAPRQAARIAGYGYLAIFVLAIFANFFVRERLNQHLGTGSKRHGSDRYPAHSHGHLSPVQGAIR
jgi:hypothetical protein